MFRAYVASAILALGLYGFAQMKGWSVLPSEAQEFKSRRAEERESRYSGSGRSGSGGGFSGK